MKFQDFKKSEQALMKEDQIFLSMKTTFQKLLKQFTEAKNSPEQKNESSGSSTQFLFPLILLKLQMMLNVIHQGQENSIKLKQAFQKLSVQIDRKIKNQKRLQSLQTQIQSLKPSLSPYKQMQQKQAPLKQYKIGQRSEEKEFQHHQRQGLYPNSIYHSLYYQQSFNPHYYNHSFPTCVPNNYSHYLPPQSYIDWQNQRRIQHFQLQNTYQLCFEHYPTNYSYMYPYKFKENQINYPDIKCQKTIMNQAEKQKNMQCKIYNPQQNWYNQNPAKKVKRQ